jgi:hypothetical protein
MIKEYKQAGSGTLKSVQAANDAFWSKDGLKPANEVTARLEKEHEEASKALKAVSGGGRFNITSNEVRSTEKYKQAKLAHSKAFAALRAHNASRAKP